MENLALTTNKRTGDIYRWEGGLRFKNLTTGREGELQTREQAQGAFAIPLHLNELAGKNQNLVSLIEGLGLAINNE